MTVLEDVADYIKRSAPRPVCDDCIAKGPGLSVRQHANLKTRGLAAQPDFDRRVDVCRECVATKKVIRSV